MAKDNLDEFELFYQEIPVSRDYLDETEIEDFVDTNESTDQKKGLTAEQVSMLAQDALSSQRSADTSQPSREESKSDNDSAPHLF